MLIQPLDREALRQQYSNAKPFPFVKAEKFLDPAFAADVAAAYPSFENATTQGRTFNAVNERKKVQITDENRFPGPVAKLNEALASPDFLSDLSYITGIPDLVADETLDGGGMHITGPGGRLDVHVDFNYLENRKLHRRLNLLLYLNPVWEERWGGHIQLWDEHVKHCRQSFAPALNRCVIFETSEISFHGVTPITTAASFPRISFATYYYTRQAPPNWTGTVHSTIFKARPEERFRRYILMPAEIVQQRLTTGVRHIKQGVKRLVSAAR
jgi:2OG-Fe(II) oxygenase superfamily